MPQSEDIEVVQHEPEQKLVAPEQASQPIPFSEPSDAYEADVFSKRTSDLKFIDRITQPFVEFFRSFTPTPAEKEVEILSPQRLPDEEVDLAPGYRTWSQMKLDSTGPVAAYDLQQRNTRVQSAQQAIFRSIQENGPALLQQQIEQTGIEIDGRPKVPNKTIGATEMVAQVIGRGTGREMAMGAGQFLLDALDVPGSLLRQHVMMMAGVAPESMSEIIHFPTDRFMERIGMDMDQIMANSDPELTFWTTLAATIAVGTATDPLMIGGASKAVPKETINAGQTAKVVEKLQTTANLTPEAIAGARQKAVQDTMNAFAETGGSGATYNLFDGSLAGQDRWAVSIFPEREVVIEGRAVTPDDIEQFMAKNADLLSDRRVSIGLWKDSDGAVHLEPSVTIPEKEEAIALGKRYDQQGIVNLRDPENSFISTGGSGKPQIDKLPPLEERLNFGALKEQDKLTGIAGVFEEIEISAADAIRAVKPGQQIARGSQEFNQMVSVGAAAIHAHGGRISREAFKKELAARLPAYVLEALDSKEVGVLLDRAVREYRKVVTRMANLPEISRLNELFREGKHVQHWYDDFRHTVEATFSTETYMLASGKVTSDAEQFTRFFAATSPQTSVEENLSRAIEAFTEWKAGKPFTNDFAGHRGNLERVAEGLPFGDTSPKVKAFYNNLWGDPRSVTVDTWMFRAFGIDRAAVEAGRGTSIGSIRFIQETIRREADILGVEPRQYQAALWTAQRLIDGEGGAEAVSETFKRVVRQSFEENPERWQHLAGADNILKGVRGEKGSTHMGLVFALARSIAGAIAGTAAAPDDAELEGALVGTLVGAFGPAAVKQAVNLLREQKGPAKPFFATARGRELARQARQERAWTQSVMARMYQRELDEFVQGVRTRRQVAEEADLLVDWGLINPETIRSYFPGQAMNDAQIVAMNRVMSQSAMHLKNLAENLDPTDSASVTEFLKHMFNHSTLDVRRLAARAESGRALGVLEDIEGQTAFLDQFSDLAGRLKMKQSPARLAEMVRSLQTPEQVTTFARNAAKPGFRDMVTELWINGLLSGPKTLAVNFGGNSAFLLWNIGERGVSRIFGNNIAPGEGAAMLTGALEAFTDGLRVAWRTLRDEDQAASIIGKIEQRRKAITSDNINNLPIMRKLGLSVNEVGPVGSALDWLGNTIAKVPVGPAQEVGGLVSSFKNKGSLIRLPGRILVATDEFFKGLAFRAELRALARREAFAEIRSQGLTGRAAKRELDQRMMQILNDPPESIVRDAKKFAAYTTFTNELGPAGQALQQLTKVSPAARVVMPFVRTPVNIFKAGFLQRTPLGLVSAEFREAIRKGGPEAQTAMARLSFGSMTMALAASWAANGILTGSGPEDPNLRRELRARGWEPYAVNISKIARLSSGQDEGIDPQPGDQYISFSRLEPIGMMFGLAADFSQISGQLREDERQTLAGALVMAISRNAASKTFVKGLAEATMALTHPDRYMENTVEKQVSTLMPFSQLVSQTTRAIDPTIRDARTMLDSYKARVWPFSKDVPCSRNMFAECGEYSPGLGPDIASPFYTNSVEPDPVVDAMIADQMSPNLPSRMMGKIELGPQLYEELQILVGKEIRIGGKNLHEKLAEIVQRAEATGRTTGPDSWRSGEMKKAYNDFKRRGRRELLRRHESLKLAVRAQERAARAAGITSPSTQTLEFDDELFEVR